MILHSIPIREISPVVEKLTEQSNRKVLPKQHVSYTRTIEMNLE